MLKKIFIVLIFFAFPQLSFSGSTEELKCKNQTSAIEVLSPVAAAGPFCINYNGGFPNGPDTIYVCDGDSA
ncbi:MAG: hypothetical protein HKO56_00475, partial [Bacteroidia bacterium]|nr:hypothetical protein [Bacteroidia bacterium]